jgi:hypothetical protein
MLRFVPDSWQEALLRPLLLADPVAGLYTEIQAPDWRYAWLILFLLMAKATDRKRAVLDAVQWRVFIGLMLAFYLWTWVSGNGRYFMWGLLVVGPLVVVAARRLRATLSMRNTLIAGVLAIQGWLAWTVYETNAWALRPWAEGPGVTQLAGRLAEQPAVFLTLGSNSYSILVPQMHPLSRWSSVAGQQDLVPGMPEWSRLQALIASPLPKFAVFRSFRAVMATNSQPNDATLAILRSAFVRYGLAPSAKPCTFVGTGQGGLPVNLTAAEKFDRGFRFCELERVAVPTGESAPRKPPAPELDDVFLAVERLCPRFFPTGNAITRLSDDGVLRLYSQSDASININDAGTVYFASGRALNPTLVGTVEGFRAGRVKIECDRLPGRYRAPWRRGWDINFD